MNLQFLGDALDCWKGALFGLLQKGKILRNFAELEPPSSVGSYADPAIPAKARRTESTRKLRRDRSEFAECENLTFEAASILCALHFCLTVCLPKVRREISV